MGFKMAENQHNERKATRYQGVSQRESRTRLHKGKPDICYSIDYRDPITGKRIRKTIGWRSKGITAEYANSVRTGIESTRTKEKYSTFVPIEMDKTPTFQQAWEIYKRDYLEATNAKGLTEKSGFFNNHLQDLAPLHLHQITTQELEILQNRILRKGLAVQTSVTILALVRHIMNKMDAWGYYHGPNPFKGLKRLRVNNQRQRFLTPYEAQAILETLEGMGSRMYLISLISLHCGLRFGEITALRHFDLDFNNLTIHIRDPKGGRDRLAIMTAKVKEKIQSLPKGRGNQLLFPTRRNEQLKDKDKLFEKVIDAFEINLGVTDPRQKVVFHTLRHTYASSLARQGFSQTVIADMLGHSTLEMSRRYTHLMPEHRVKTAQAVQAYFNNEHPDSPK